MLLAFLTHLDNWRPSIGAQEQEKQELCTFLESAISRLTSHQGRAWQLRVKLFKHVGLTILIKVQLIIVKFVWAIADSKNVEIDFATGPIDYNIDSDLASGIQLMSYFKTVFQNQLRARNAN